MLRRPRLEVHFSHDAVDALGGGLGDRSGMTERAMEQFWRCQRSRLYFFRASAVKRHSSSISCVVISSSTSTSTRTTTQ